MFATFQPRFANWLFQNRGVEPGAIVLTRRRIYILPTRPGFGFAVVLLMMLAGSINYQLSLGFVLTFLLVAMAFNAMLYTFRNLVRMRVSAGRTRPVFAGEHAQFTIHIENTEGPDRYAIGLARDRKNVHGADYADVPAGRTASLSVSITAVKRGLLRPGRLMLFTRYPLGLYFSWSYVEPDMQCVVYPRPAPPGIALPPAQATNGVGRAGGSGHEDFAGLRQYHVGDSPRHIAWKAAARGQGLLTKQFSGQAASELWLSWDLLPLRMGVEEKLSLLARWVLDAHALGMAFGLRLPDLTIAIASGDAQRERCLEALALYDMGHLELDAKT
jgi:uncharacterized protein (DUF58 family)